MKSAINELADEMVAQLQLERENSEYIYQNFVTQTTFFAMG
jgi:hypothetical protein